MQYSYKAGVYILQNIASCGREMLCRPWWHFLYIPEALPIIFQPWIGKCKKTSTQPFDRTNAIIIIIEHLFKCYYLQNTPCDRTLDLSYIVTKYKNGSRLLGHIATYNHSQCINFILGELYHEQYNEHGVMIEKSMSDNELINKYLG